MKISDGYATYFSCNGDYPATVMCSTAVSVYARLRDYALIPNKDDVYWAITVFYKDCAILTLNSDMF